MNRRLCLSLLVVFAFMAALLPAPAALAQQENVQPDGSFDLLSSGIESNPSFPAQPPSIAQGGTALLDQPPNQSNGIFSDASCDICTGAQVLAENFLLSDAAQIGQIVFWTGYFPNDVPIDPDNLTVIFHEDADGAPGAALYTENNVAYSREQTGVILFGVHEWMHTLTLAAPVSLAAGTYWVEIYNDTGFDTDDFFWEVGDLDPVAGVVGSAYAFEAPGATWSLDSSQDLAIQLIEAEVPCDWENRLLENFASTTFPPTGWTRYNLDTGSTQWNRSTSYYHSSPGSAYHNYSSTPTTGQDGWLVSPRLSDLELMTTLKFWERASFAADYAYHGIWVSTGSCVPTDGDFVEVAEIGSATSSFVQKTVDLAAYEGQEPCVAFVYRGYMADAWYIDDVQVDTCVPPPLVVTPLEQNNPGCQGGTAVHSIVVRNASGEPHTYEASVTGNDWPTSPISTTFTLTVEEKITLDFAVDIPFTVFDGESDAIDITVAAQDDPTMTETVSATAYAGKIWVPAPEGGEATLWPAYAGDGTSLFYFDGKDEDGTVTDRLQVYSPGAGWIKRSGDRVPLYGSVAGYASNGLIYVAGGFEDGQIGTDLFKAYDPATNIWTSLTAMPEALGLGAGGVVGDQFVWIGGSPNSGLLSYTPVYVYDIAGDSWAAGTSLTDVGFTAPGYVVADGKVYVAGNWLGSNRFYAYDVTADSWTQLAGLPADAGKVSPLLIYDGDDEIYLVAGGTAPSQATDAVYRYVISEDAWYEAESPLNWPTLGNGGGLLGGYLYTFGGGLNVGAAQAEDGVAPHEFRLLRCPDLDTAILDGYVINGVTDEPIEGALVEVVGAKAEVLAGTTPFAYTDENGYYELTLYTPATYEITASYMDFDPKTAEVMLPVEGASQDFVLGPAVASPSPTSFSVTLPWGEQDIRAMTLANDGYSALHFEFMESDGGGPYMEGYGPQSPVEPLATPSEKVVQEAKLLLDSQPAAAEPDELLAPPSEVELVMDDGTQENGLVLRDPDTLIEFRAVLFNRFEAASVPAEPFAIEYIDIHEDTGQLQGKDIQLLVYVDPDGGNPQNAILVYDEVVQVQDETGWNSYELATPVAIDGPVDVLVGFSTIYAAGGVPWPSGVRYPYPMDETSPQGNSYLAWMNTPQEAVDPSNLGSFPNFLEMGSLGYPANWLVRGYGSLGGGEIVWLSEDPITGTIPMLESISVNLTFDASAVAEFGAYAGTLTLNSNDLASPAIAMPVELIVTENPDAGLIQGTVTTDRPGGPMEGAAVHLEGPAGFDEILTTDAAGYYEQRIPPANVGVFTITVSAAGYFDDVQMVAVEPGATVHDVELEFIGPWIAVDPTVLEQTLLWGETAEDYVEITNAGNQDLDYTVTMPLGVLLWEEFESWPPPGWTIVNNGGNCVWMSSADYGRPNYTGGAGDAADADSDDCGSGTTMNTDLYSPILDLSGAVAAQLTFKYDYNNLVSTEQAALDVSPDSGASWYNIFTWNTDHRGPATHSLDLTPFLGGSGIVLRWHYLAPGWDWWWEIDDVLVEAAFPADWLTWTPTSGTVLPDGADTVTITKDASAVPMPGVYTAELLVEHNDPLQPQIPISITMNVVDNPDQGHIYGAVLGSRTAGGANMPLEGAHVVLSGPFFFETWTDENGEYEFYLLPSQLGNYMVYVEKPGYITDISATLPVGPGDNIEHNVTLRLVASWLMVDPEAIAETLPWGGSTTVPMTVMNPPDATARLQASMFETTPSFTPLPVQTLQIDIDASPPIILTEGVVLDDPAAPAAPARTVDVSLLNLSLQPLKVLILSDDANQGALDGLDIWLDWYPDLDVDVWLATDGFPTLADLMPYHTVIVGGRYAFSNAGAEWTAEALGNVMADYVDAGGSVIMIQNAWLIDDATGAQYALGGRFEAELSPVDYRYTSGETYTYADRALGFYLAGHPLMDDVDYIVDHLRAYTDLMVRPYAEAVAYYNDGELYVAANPGKVVLLNQVLTYGWNWEGDVPTLVHNAIVYLAPSDAPWLDETVTEFDLPVGGSAGTEIMLDASVPEVDQPGIYGAWLWFVNNDPFQQGAYVPVEMTVEADPTMGNLHGTVYLNRAPAGEMAPADGATVMLESTAGTTELHTQPDGTYTYYFLAAGLPAEVTITASYPDYQDEAVTVTVNSGESTSADLTLELLAPWLQVSPLALEVAIPGDMQTTLTMDVENLGLTDLIIPLIQEIPATATLPVETPLTPVTWVDKEFTVDAEVDSALQAEGATTDFFIWMRERADLSRAYNIVDKNQRREFVFETLTQTADRSQAGIRKYLDSRGLDYEVFWINNSILVHDGDRAVVEAMRSRGDVYRIRGVYTKMYIPDPEQLAIVTLDESSVSSNPTWNIAIVNAPQVWDQLNVTGKGAVVSSIDTGVRYTHEALNSSYRGNLGNGVYDHNYNWGSLYGNGPTACPGSPLAPCDWAGHGSHTMGTMIGGDGNGPFDMDIGMAPDAKWMACMGCDTPPNACSDAALTGCAQWMVAPLDLNGLNPDPTMAPDVVNNSWGGGGEDEWYYSYVEAWHAANIIPVFSAGNEGPDCRTLGSPGNYDNVIGMGGTDNADYNYTYSSRGPGSGSGVFPLQKPDLAAPAEGVPSSVNTSDSSYANYSGTSMAAPHMCGLVALMRSVDPTISFDEVWNIATANTVTETLDIKNGSWCGLGPDFPNYVFGYGRIDAFAAVSDVQVEMDIPWLSLVPVSGTVPPAGTMPVEVTFDSTDLEDGVYTGTLRILHNDPLGGKALIPVQLTVRPYQPELYLTKTVEPVHQYPGGPVTYTIVFGNEGELATDVVITDVLPAEVVFVSADEEGEYDEDLHAVSWGPLTLTEGAEVTAHVVGILDTDAPPDTWMTNTVTLHYGDMEPLTDQAVHHRQPYQLSLDKTVEPAEQYPGEPVTYTIVFANEAILDITGIVISDVLPAEVEFVSADPAGAYDADTHEVSWVVDLMASEVVTATVRVKIGADVASDTWVTNTVNLIHPDGTMMDEAAHYVKSPTPYRYYRYLPIVSKNY